MLLKRKENLGFLLIILGIFIAGVVSRNHAIIPDQDASFPPISVDGIVPSAGPPVVSITSPQNGQTVNGMVNIISNATAAGIMVRMEIKIDGISVHVNTTTTSLPSMSTAFVWNTSAYSDGNHTIVANATDNGGNSGNITIWVIVQNFPVIPVVIISAGIGVVLIAIVIKSVSGRKKAGSRKPGNAGNIKAFNPQPEPPGKQGRVKEFNPQPEPPGKQGRVKEFNPQPEPPGKQGRVKEFNPQPEPPGKSGNIKEFNPQPEPPGKNQKIKKKKKQIKK